MAILSQTVSGERSITPDFGFQSASHCQTRSVVAGRFAGNPIDLSGSREISRRQPAPASWPPRARRSARNRPLAPDCRDWHMLRHVELQPLDVAEQYDRVFSDVRQISSLRRRRVEIGVHEDLRLRQIGRRRG